MRPSDDPNYPFVLPSIRIVKLETIRHVYWQSDAEFNGQLYRQRMGGIQG